MCLLGTSSFDYAGGKSTSVVCFICLLYMSMSAVLLAADPQTSASLLLLYCTQVVALLQEMGLDTADVRPLRKAGLTGAELLLLEEEQLMDLLRLPKHKARRLKRLQVR